MDEVRELFDTNTRIDALNQDRIVKTEIKVLESQPIEDVIRSEIGRKVPSVQGGQESGRNILTAAVSTTDKELARAAANAYAVSYIDFRRIQAVNDVLDASKQVDGRGQELRGPDPSRHGRRGHLRLPDAVRRAGPATLGPPARPVPGDEVLCR